MLSWKIYTVFDPDGNGADFAYTEGLWPRHPELFVWARPSDGDDPGVDWALSANDRGHLLNALADDVLSGRRRIGDQWTATCDGGLTTVHYHLEDACRADRTEAHRLDPSTPVSTLRFAIDRGAICDRPAGPRQAAIAARLARRLTAAGDDRDACFGPAHGVTLAPVDATLLGSWAAAVDEVRRAVVDLRTLGPLTGAIVVRDQIDASLGITQAAARRTGRFTAFNAAVDLATADADALADVDPEASIDPLWRSALRTHLRMVLAAAYTTIVVADVIDAEARAGGCGWVATLADPGGAARRFAGRVERARVGGGRSMAPGRSGRRVGQPRTVPVRGGSVRRTFGRDEVDAARVVAATHGCGGDLYRDHAAVAVDLTVLGFPPGC